MKIENDLMTAEERELLASSTEEDAADLEALAGDDAAEADASGAEGETSESQGDSPVTPEIPPVYTPTFTGQDPEDARAQIKGVDKSIREVNQKWRDGELDDDGRDAQLAELQEKRDELLSQEVAARTAQEFSAQSARQAFTYQRDYFLKLVEKTEGVPYLSNGMVRQQFDAALAAAGQKALDEKRDPTAEELFAEADRAVRAQFAGLGVTFGKKSGPSSQSPGATPEGQQLKKPRDVPKTLADMPAAAMADVGSGGELAALAQLEGDDLEMAVARLSPQKRRELVNRSA